MGDVIDIFSGEHLGILPTQSSPNTTYEDKVETVVIGDIQEFDGMKSSGADMETARRLAKIFASQIQKPQL